MLRESRKNDKNRHKQTTKYIEELKKTATKNTTYRTGEDRLLSTMMQ